MGVATFPLPGTPSSGFAQATLEINRRQSAGLLAGGRDYVVDQGAPAWSLSLKSVPLLDSQIGQWKAFKSKLRGAARFFTMWDPLREYPGRYMPAGWGVLTRVGGGTFNGSATLTSIANSGLADGGRDVITIGTLPAGLVIGPGDYVQLTTGAGLISLHRVLDDPGVTSSGGGTATLWIEPAVPAGYTTAATANLYRPSAKWRVLDLQIPVDAQGRNRPAQATLTAVSVQL